MLIEIEQYKDFRNLKNLHRIAQVLMNNIDLKKLEEYFSNQSNDNYKNETWFLVQYKNGKRQFKTNNSQFEDVEVDENQPEVESSWFYISLYDTNWYEETRFDPFVERNFYDLIFELKKIRGLRVAGIHFASPQAIISQHKDYESSENCNNAVLVLKSNGAKFKISNQEHILNSNQTFIFDASLPHSLENFTDKYFVILTMRIDKDFIK